MCDYIHFMERTPGNFAYVDIAILSREADVVNGDVHTFTYFTLYVLNFSEGT